MNCWLTVIGVVLLMVLVAYTSSDGIKEAALDLELYCEMVTIRKATEDPYLGWPDYKGIYAEQCLTSEKH